MALVTIVQKWRSLLIAYCKNVIHELLAQVEQNNVMQYEDIRNVGMENNNLCCQGNPNMCFS